MKGYSEPGDQMDALSLFSMPLLKLQSNQGKLRKKRKNIRTGTREYLHLVLK
jgi:hypothetical protein